MKEDLKIEILDTIDQLESCQDKIEMLLERLTSDTEKTIAYLKDQGKDSVIIDADIESALIYLNILNDYRNVARDKVNYLKEIFSED